MRYTALFLSILLCVPGCSLFKGTSDLTLQEKATLAQSISYTTTFIALVEVDDAKVSRMVADAGSYIDTLLSSAGGNITLQDVDSAISSMTEDPRIRALGRSLGALVLTYLDLDKVTDPADDFIGKDNVFVLRAMLRGVIEGARASERTILSQ